MDKLHDLRVFHREIPYGGPHAVIRLYPLIGHLSLILIPVPFPFPIWLSLSLQKSTAAIRLSLTLTKRFAIIYT